MSEEKQYVVTAAAAYFTTVGPDGQERLELLYAGAPVPPSTSDASIAHHLDAGLIAQVEDVVLLEPAGDTGNGQGSGDVALEEPARNASTEEWKAFALAKGAQPEDVDGLKRDELVELFGTPTGS